MMSIEVEDVWRKLQPKVRKGNCNSSLSQMSMSSSFSRNSRLSLSQSFPLPGPSKVTRSPTEPVVLLEGGTPKKCLGTPSRSSTPRISVACVTPKFNNSFKKSSPSSRKKNANKGTPDGLQQLSLERFFSTTPLKKVETPKVNENNVIELSSDSSEDEIESNNEKEKQTKTTKSKASNSASVSRVLFLNSESDSLEAAAKEPVTKIKTTDAVEGACAGFIFKEPRTRTLIKSDSTNGESSKMCISRQENVLQPTETADMGEKHSNFCVDPVTSRLPLDRKAYQGNCTIKEMAWMTKESSKLYRVQQWKNLMQKMRSGQQSCQSSSSSDFNSAMPRASSIQQGSYYLCRGRPGYRKSCGQRVCPVYKRILGTTFAVDAFSYGSVPGITHYFLSHFHYDHYMGLRKDFSHPIYCSSVTANLVALKIGVKDNLLRRIDPGQTVTIDCTKITAMDANHCPGSLMLLFELPDGRTHLHVGDFRANLHMESYHALWNVDIDQLYLDTTYCDPTYNFPSQERVIENVLAIVEGAISKDSKTLIVCGSYTIGKERVFAAISKQFNFKVWAPADKRRIYDCVKKGLLELSHLQRGCAGVSEGGALRELDLLEILSRRISHIKEDAQIHVLPMSKIKKKCLSDHLLSIRGSTFTNVVAFLPTGWSHHQENGNNESNLSLNSPSIKIYKVPYSEHSSFLELERFVKFIRPMKVVKTVNANSPQQCVAMELHINEWLKENHSKVPLPSRNPDSPESSLATAEQKEAGVFNAGRRRNVLSRMITGSYFALSPQSNSRQTLTSRGVLCSNDVPIHSQHVEDSNEQRDKENFLRTPGIALKRTGSPTGRPPPKKHWS